MPKIFNTLTALLALTGCVSLFASGEMNPVLSVMGIALFYGYYRLMTGMPQAPKWSVSLLSVITLILFLFDTFMVSDDYLLSVANLTIFFQAIKSYDMREPWDHLQVSFMSLLQLIITSELTHSIIFGALFIFFLVALVGAIVLAHFIKASPRPVPVRRILLRISLLTLVLTCAIFVAMPRIAGGLWGRGHQKGIKTAGFSEKVDFGSFGDMKLDPTIVMRVEMSDYGRGPYYWRGMTLDYFDGVSWRESASNRRWILRRDGLFNIAPFTRKDEVVQRIFLEPLDTDVLFGLSEIAVIEANARVIYVDQAQAVFLPYKRGKQAYYTVHSVREPLPGDSTAGSYLQLPAGMEKVRRLAARVSAGSATELEKARSIERHLRENYTYSLETSPPPEGVTPLEDFLFRSRRGYCEHYATSMAVMLRTLGIPSRIVNGFYGGEVNDFGGYLIVRQSNAHSWVEALINRKWMSFDPTPAVSEEQPSAISLYLDMLRMKWNRYVVSFSSSDQRDLVRVFALPFRLSPLPDLRTGNLRAPGLSAVFAALVLVLVCAMLFRTIKAKRHDFVTSGYIELRKALRKKGIDVSPHQTPGELRIAASGSGLDNEISEFLRIYEECRFGRKEMSGSERGMYRRLLGEIKTPARRAQRSQKPS